MVNGDKPAFPRPIGSYSSSCGGGYNTSQSGMTKQEYFAGLAMQGMLARIQFDPTHGLRSQSWHNDLAIEACKIADTLIEELNKK